MESRESRLSPETITRDRSVCVIYFPPGEGRPSLGEAMGPAVLAGSYQEFLGEKMGIIDTQEQMVNYGRILTTDLVDQIEREKVGVLGLSIPQGAWDYPLSLLIQLEERFTEKKEEMPLVILGNNVPTWATKEILTMFPWVVIIKGEGEKAWVEVIDRLKKGETINEIQGDIGNLAHVRQEVDGGFEIIENEYQTVAINEAYPLPDRQTLKELILKNNGIVRIEASRGCPKSDLSCGACSFCPRIKGEWRIIPVDLVLKDLEQIVDVWRELKAEGRGPEKLNFEFTDEEFLGFNNIPGNYQRLENLVEGIKDLGLGEDLGFSISTRADCFLSADKKDLITKLQEAGLKKVYFGFEGGDDDYLKSLNKHSSVAKNEKALARAQKLELEVEFGYISAAWRMDFKQLGKNINWLEKDDHWKYASSILNELDVRKGSAEAEILRAIIAGRGEKFEQYEKENFDINLSRYEVAGEYYQNTRVWQVLEPIRRWKNEQRRIYFTLKALERAEMATEYHQPVKEFLERFKQLDLKVLTGIYSLVEQRKEGMIPNKITASKGERWEIMQDLMNSFNVGGLKGTKEGLRWILEREIGRFVQEESARVRAQDKLEGVALVIEDDQGRYLLVRSKGESEWGFIGEKKKDEEDLLVVTRRGLEEELGLRGGEIRILEEESFWDYERRSYEDEPGSIYEEFILHHLPLRIEGFDLKREEVGLELADAMWVSQDELTRGRLRLKPNVLKAIKKYEKENS